MQSFIVKKSIALNATPAEVWDALTNPEKTKEYFFHCEVHSTWEVGSPISFKGKIFFIKKIEMNGTVLAVEPERLLKYNLVNEGDEGHSISTVTDELKYENGQTILSISDDVGDGDESQERYEKSDKGWDKVLKGLKELVEKANFD